MGNTLAHVSPREPKRDNGDNKSRIPKRVSGDTVEEDISGEFSPVIKSFSLSVSSRGILSNSQKSKLLFFSDLAQAFRLHQDSVPHSLVSYSLSNNPPRPPRQRCNTQMGHDTSVNWGFSLRN